MRRGKRRPDYTHCTDCGDELATANIVYTNYRYVDGVERRTLNVCNLCRNRRKIASNNRRRMSIRVNGKRVPIGDNATARDHPHFKRWLAEMVGEIRRVSG